MLTSTRVLPALGLLLAGCFAADAWHKRAKARDANHKLSHEIKNAVRSLESIRVRDLTKLLGSVRVG